MATYTGRVKLKTMTAANWTSGNPTLLENEYGWESDTGKVKRGDGSTAWTSLDYIIDTSYVSDLAVDFLALETLTEQREALLIRFTPSATFDGGGAAPTVNSGVQSFCAKSGIITSASLVLTDDAGDRTTGTCTVTFYKIASGGSSTTLGTVSLSAASYIEDTTLSGWTTTVAAGESIKFKLTTAPSTGTRLSAALKCLET